jgi:transcriptional regulator with XRE-family HTH domain
MPRVKPLTQKQSKEAALAASYSQVSDGLALVKNRERITMDQMGERLGMTRQKVAKLLRRESVSVDFETALNIIDLAGYRLKPKEKEELQ